VADGTGERLVEAVSQGSLVLASPLEYLDGGRVRFTLVGSSADLRAAVDAIPDDIRVELDRVGAYDDPAANGLTDRQRDALGAAVEVGYYEVPRRGTVADAAERLDCASGTASEHLRKAEATLVYEAVGAPSRR
jgi:predicted DNA binding protein